MNSMEIPVQLPFPQLRSGGLFFDVATPLDLTYAGRDRTGVGVVHVPFGCDPMFFGPSEACSTSDVDGIDTGATDLEPKDAAIRDYPDQVIHPAFKVVDGLQCSSISLPNSEQSGDATLSDRLSARYRLQISKMATAELVSGAASGGPSLSSEATDLGTGTMADAAFALETWLASSLHNGVGVILIPVGSLAEVKGVNWIDPNAMSTVTGHGVIADAGYTGEPADPTVFDPATRVLYALGVPAYSVTDQNVLALASGMSMVDITDNMVRAISESYMQLAFDPCTVASFTVVPGSGGGGNGLEAG